MTGDVVDIVVEVMLAVGRHFFMLTARSSGSSGRLRCTMCIIKRLITALGGRAATTSGQLAVRALTVSVVTLTAGPPDGFYSGGGRASDRCPWLVLIVTPVLLLLTATAAPLTGQSDPIVDDAAPHRLLCDISVDADMLARLSRGCNGLT